MKKNKMMRVASFLLVAVLLSTSVISGTFAKYVTEGGAEDVARVAKWGVVITGAGTLYADSYKLTSNTPGGDDTADPAAAPNATLSVVSSTTAATIKGSHDKDKVVAPGTKNDTGLTITVTGQPEVDGKITMNVRNSNGDDFNVAKDDIYLKAGTYALMVKVGKIDKGSFKADTYYTLSGGTYTLATAWEDVDYYALHDKVTTTADYYPVVYKINGTAVGEALNESSLKAVADSGLEVSFNANQNLATDIDLDAVTADNQNKVTVTWEWAFEQGADDAAKKINNGADTILGHLADGKTTAGDACVVKLSGTTPSLLENQVDYNITSSIQMLVAATQVD